MSTARARLARNVRLLLAIEGWNQLDLARRTGLSQGMISQLLAGEKGVRLSTLDKVADALRVDVGELFTAIPHGSATSSSDLQSAVRSAVSSAARAVPATEGTEGRKLLIDPEELREMGFAIGYAIVEATQRNTRRLAETQSKDKSSTRTVVRQPRRSQAK